MLATARAVFTRRDAKVIELTEVKEHSDQVEIIRPNYARVMSNMQVVF